MTKKGGASEERGTGGEKGVFDSGSFEIEKELLGQWGEGEGEGGGGGGGEKEREKALEVGGGWSGEWEKRGREGSILANFRESFRYGVVDFDTLEKEVIFWHLSCLHITLYNISLFYISFIFLLKDFVLFFFFLIFQIFFPIGSPCFELKRR